MTDKLGVRLNRAAEAAAPKAQVLLIDAVSRTVIEDVRQILGGPWDAATQYLRRQMEKVWKMK